MHNAQSAQSRAQLTQARLEQEKNIVEKANKWLNEELERKSEAFNAERRKATDSIVDLQRKVSEAESRTQSLEEETKRLGEKVEQQRKAAEVGVWGRMVRGEKDSRGGGTGDIIDIVATRQRFCSHPLSTQTRTRTYCRTLLPSCAMCARRQL